MAGFHESSQFLLQPLAQRQSHNANHQDHADDTDETRAEALSRPSGGSHDQSHSDSNDLSTKHTGLLIQDAALTSPSADGAKKNVNGLHSQHRRHASNTFLTWSLELALLLVAAGLLVAIIVILLTYSDNEVPNWNGDDNTGGITLNALVALIATIFRAILAFIALQVLAQLKWDWVAARFRPVRDMQRFDDASRGVWGSLQLLPAVALRQPLAVVAVVVVVASLAIGPVTQQTMQTYYCLRDAAGRPAAITVANRVVDETLYYSQRSVMYALNVGLQSAMQDAVVNPSNDSNIATLFTCPSGNCTFIAYSDHPGQPADERVSHASIGMCSRCEDVYELVQKYNETTLGLTVSKPSHNSNETKRLAITPGTPATGGTKYLASSVTGNLAWAHQAVPRDFLNTARWSAANFSILAFSQDRCNKLPNSTVSCSLFAKPYEINRQAWDQPTDYIAATCILYPCVKYYAGTVRDGALSERVVRSTPLRPQNPEALSGGGELAMALRWAGVQTPCRVNDTLYTSSNMSSASAQLPPDAKETVNAHSKDWASDDIDTPAGYTNVTAPRECVATLWSGFLSALQYELIESFSAECSPRGHQTEVVSCTSSSGGTSMSMAALLRPRSTSLDTIRENVSSMAMRITTEMRRTGWGARTEAAATVEGEAKENRTCIRVEWGWFALPAALLLLCAVLLGWVIVRDLRARNGSVIWKSSVLPFLLKDYVPAIETMSLKDLDAAAGGLEVKLQKLE
ncbi:hypothetical protein B0T10DRAFT_269430 [Thelonectria olida]|uniref:Uncharacterized protein n=1 Tax=Thelonectria olida TaxID=1576542 RepID=A0A9P8WA26_9HYPO|nr:hypothetical protein B0T10DRAFT_269430 [Thelonectria olida]